jgi:hypothetical protein
MRLRNKKTGKIWHMPRLRQPTVQEDDISFFACTGEHGCSRGELFSYKSLAELNEEWEDYKPAEPLIKDEKIRKAVRAWAEACGVNRVVNGEYDNELCAKGQQFYGAKIVLTKTVALPRGKNYTIAELCGEEEE